MIITNLDLLCAHNNLYLIFFTYFIAQNIPRDIYNWLNMHMMYRWSHLCCVCIMYAVLYIQRYCILNVLLDSQHRNFSFLYLWIFIFCNILNFPWESFHLAISMVFNIGETAVQSTTKCWWWWGWWMVGRGRTLR